MEFSYRFPVVKGVQAKREYYIAMVPLKMIPKLFPAEDEYVLPEHRAQRRLNTSRIPEICKYIIDNRDTYVFSALAASIDGNFSFHPTDFPDIGILEVSMDAKILINDGQHRKAAILEAISEDSTLLDETISVVFFEDQGLERSQQMFTDLNKHAVKTSNSMIHVIRWPLQPEIWLQKLIFSILIQIRKKTTLANTLPTSLLSTHFMWPIRKLFQGLVSMIQQKPSY